MSRRVQRCFPPDDACLEGHNGHGTIGFSEQNGDSQGQGTKVPVPVQPQRATAARICPPRHNLDANRDPGTRESTVESNQPPIARLPSLAL